jgi:hypothetical protein
VGQTGHAGELGPKVGRESLDRLVAPVRLFGPFGEDAAELPVELDEFGLTSAERGTRLANTLLQSRQDIRIVIGKCQVSHEPEPLKALSDSADQIRLGCRSGSSMNDYRAAVIGTIGSDVAR